MTNSEIAKTIDKLAFYLSLQDENKHIINAFQRAAKNITKHPLEIEEMLLNGTELTVIPGIGKIIAKKIEDMLIFGEHKFLAPYQQNLPDSLYELSQIKGLGPKTILKLYHDYQISTLKDLHFCFQQKGTLHLPSSLEEQIRQFFCI